VAKRYGYKDYENYPVFQKFTDGLINEIADKNIDKFVVDLRNNTGGDSSLMTALVDKLASINKLKGKIYVMIGRETFSSGVMKGEFKLSNKVLDKCCCKSANEASQAMEENNLCPVCKSKGIKVKNYTVSNLVIDIFKESVGAADYYLCMKEQCDITYFNNETGTSFNKEQVKVPMWFKKDASPKYVCYCSKVTEEQVIDAVIKDGANNMKDVLKLTGAMKNSNCKKNNPLGKCCHEIIQEAINKGLSI